MNGVHAMVIVKPVAVSVALLSVTLVSPAAADLPQPIGVMSCDLVTDYVETSPPYYAQLKAFLQGYLAGVKGPAALGSGDREATAVMAEVIDYCKKQPNADLASAIAAAGRK